jgi:hypothetical protein
VQPYANDALVAYGVGYTVVRLRYFSVAALHDAAICICHSYSGSNGLNHAGFYDSHWLSGGGFVEVGGLSSRAGLHGLRAWLVTVILL